MSSITFKNIFYCSKLYLYGIIDSNLLFSAEIQIKAFLSMHFSYHILKVMFNIMARSTQFSKKTVSLWHLIVQRCYFYIIHLGYIWPIKPPKLSLLHYYSDMNYIFKQTKVHLFSFDSVSNKQYRNVKKYPHDLTDIWLNSIGGDII